MDSVSAFAMGEANRGKEMRVFDWDEAARRIVAAGARNASAGLSGDWEFTGGEILAGGEIPDSEWSRPYLASTWATPMLCIGCEEVPCFKMASELPGHDAETWWPESARAILAGLAVTA